MASSFVSGEPLRQHIIDRLADHRGELSMGEVATIAENIVLLVRIRFGTDTADLDKVFIALHTFAGKERASVFVQDGSSATGPYGPYCRAVYVEANEGTNIVEKLAFMVDSQVEKIISGDLGAEWEEYLDTEEEEDRNAEEDDLDAVEGSRKSEGSPKIKSKQENPE